MLADLESLDRRKQKLLRRVRICDVFYEEDKNA
jgi:hypothetical protein